MAASTIYGKSVQEATRVAKVGLTSFPVNGASILYALTVPSALGPVRVTRVEFVASAALSDADGTMLVDVDVFDASEGASDALVDAHSVEGVTAHTPLNMTLQTEGTEKEFTLDAGDSIRVTFTNNSAAIDTNGSVAVMIFYHPIPNYSGDDVRHATYYR